MCALSAVSSSFSLPYASLRYWISLASRVVGSSAMGTGAPPREGSRTPSLFPPNGASTLQTHAVGVAQLVELLVVVQAVAGSSPVAHPSKSPANAGFLLSGVAALSAPRHQ